MQRSFWIDSAMKKKLTNNLVSMAGNQTKDEVQSGVDLQEKIAKPSLYKVLLLNDDFTPMDFVVYVLKTFFHWGSLAARRGNKRRHTKPSSFFLKDRGSAIRGKQRTVSGNRPPFVNKKAKWI